MKTDPNDLINPVQCTEYAPGHFDALTKREYFAAMAMQGLLSAVYSNKEMLNEFTKYIYSPTKNRVEYISGVEAISLNALSYADALIEELNKDGK